MCRCLGEILSSSPAPTCATSEVQKSISTIPVPPEAVTRLNEALSIEWNGDEWKIKLTFCVAFAIWLTVVNPVTCLGANRDTTKVLVEVDEQQFVVALVSKVHGWYRVCRGEEEPGNNAATSNHRDFFHCVTQPVASQMPLRRSNLCMFRTSLSFPKHI